MHLTRDIREAGRAEIAQQAQFATGAGFPDSNEIEPAVVVVVDRGEPPAALPAEIGKGDALETLAFDVAPQADAGRSRVRESEVHPAVLVEIESNDADGWLQIFFCEIDAGKRGEFPAARIQVDRCALAAAGKNKIDGTVIVEVRGHQTRAGGVNVQPGLLGHVSEGAVAV